ncbi:hypothetical protein RHGRI_023880 [Rhododendron griersonianum]|uniref:Tim10-like domain-containing protein n=1 Tax=Rhododendron griersonianum TaxID=479676 RepID=A0AAV6J9B1_9ERIC|nr:hypothetical protein RHGRI_023880 [Rhododendron griersonianum]
MFVYPEIPCFNKCVEKRYKEAELNMGENSCIDRCVSKYWQVTNLIGQLLGSNQQAAAMGYLEIFYSRPSLTIYREPNPVAAAVLLDQAIEESEFESCRPVSLQQHWLLPNPRKRWKPCSAHSAAEASTTKMDKMSIMTGKKKAVRERECHKDTRDEEAEDLHRREDDETLERGIEGLLAS